ncbi:hypothetical protein PLICRDRAFT_47509 [Plicaturopsis crispa FD-325 SS-3]|uniref:Uncharacterized protein n=1 Tax=Plicaturopsis crispa FD-325 SS-3 TaxID=944288 RepID=A0A0C9SV28_PLICR|nr:hypothetical protein PLICRDRAFT_47509 [Plicaturopsis crispa FD-325 SS-3]
MSRFVAQVYSPYSNLYTPLVVSPAGSTIPVASFLFLRAQNLVMSLDSICPNAAAMAVPAGVGLIMFMPTPLLVQTVALAYPHRKKICEVIAAVLKAANKRGKRKAPANGKAAASKKKKS